MERKNTIITNRNYIRGKKKRSLLRPKLQEILEQIRDIIGLSYRTKLVHKIINEAQCRPRHPTEDDSERLTIGGENLRQSMNYVAAENRNTWEDINVLDAKDLEIKAVNGFYELTNDGVYIPLEEIGDYVKYWFIHKDEKHKDEKYHYMVKKISESEDENHISTYTTTSFSTSDTTDTSEPDSNEYIDDSLPDTIDGDAIDIVGNKFILYGGTGAGGDGGGGGGSGDPYIHPLIGPVYKLPDAPGNCRFISTKEDLNNRFLVDMSIEKLTFDEQKDLLKQHLQYNRTVLEKRKITIDGYYFRNFYISNKNNYLIVNLEDRTLKAADGEITLDHLYKKGGVATYKNFEINITKSTKDTYKKIANYDKTLVVYTVKVKTYNEVYGKVEIELFSLFNKQIRNSIQIYTENPITVNNSVGAYLMPQHINNIYVNRLGSNEMLEDVEQYNEKDYNVINEHHFHNSGIINKELLIQK